MVTLIHIKLTSEIKHHEGYIFKGSNLSDLSKPKVPVVYGWEFQE